MPDHENTPRRHPETNRVESGVAPQMLRGERVLEMVALRRTADPSVEAGRMLSRLTMTVAQWEPDACLDITFGMGRDGVEAYVTQYGTPQLSWEKDVTWALGNAELRRRVSRRRTHLRVPEQAPSWDSVCEVVAMRSVRARISGLPGGMLSAPDDAFPGHSGASVLPSAGWLAHSLRFTTTWPEPGEDDMSTIMGLLVQEPDLRLRYRLSPADPFELDVLGEAFILSFASDPERANRYFGTPVRVRALIGSVRGPVPARARAVVCRGATGLAVQHLTVSEARSAWSGGPESLIGHAVPERLMHALVRLPAAGYGPYPGFSTTSAPRVHPLDPVPAKVADSLRLGHALTTGGRKVDACIGVRDGLRHIFIEGQSGAGKSTVIASLVRGLISRGYGCAFLDPHGTTVTAILSELPADNHETVQVIRLGDEKHGIPLNVYNSSSGQLERIIAEVAETVQIMFDPKREGIVGPRWTRWFSLIAEAAAVALADRWSLLAVYEIGRDTQRVKLLAHAIRRARPELAKSLLDEIVADRSTEAASFLAWASSKLQPLVATSHMRLVLGTGADAVDLAAAADEGRAMLFDLASTTIGDTAARMYGGLVLLKAAMMMGTRTRPDRPFFVIVDEAHLFEFGGLPKLLAEGRKHGVGVVVATQHMGQLQEDLAAGLETNTGTLLTLRTGVRHAGRSSLRLGGWPVEEIVRLGNLTAAATISHDGNMTEPFTLHIDHHERMARAGARGPSARARGDEALTRSLRQMWAPYADLPPISAAEIDRLLRERLNHDRLTAPDPTEHLTTTGGFDPKRYLDDLASRQGQQLGTGVIGTESPAASSTTVRTGTAGDVLGTEDER